MNSRRISYCFYAFWMLFIAGWWAFAFWPLFTPCKQSALRSTRPLSLHSSSLLNALSPLQRESLKQALGGDFSLMVDLVNLWDRDAAFLQSKGMTEASRLPQSTLLQMRMIAFLLANSSEEEIRKINQKIALRSIVDDSGRTVKREERFSLFLPQTYLAASVMLAIARPDAIVALPRGLRELKGMFSSETLAQIPFDTGLIRSETLALKRPDVAFIAPYTYPASLEALQRQSIALCTIDAAKSIEDIQNSLLKIGHVSSHILQAQLLTYFIEAVFLSIDNRLRAIHFDDQSDKQQTRLLYVAYRNHFELPTAKSLSGQLLVRALAFFPHFTSTVPLSDFFWRIPLEKEAILQKNPDALIIAKPDFLNCEVEWSLKGTKAYQNDRLFFVDESIQESPTQYIALAYYDLFEAIAAL